MKKVFLLLIFCNASLIAMSQSSLNHQLLQAAKEGTGQQVEELILKGADILSTPSSIVHRHEIPLMVALNFKNESVWRVLIDHRFQEQAVMRGMNGYTLMHYAAGNHCMEVFTKLKELRVDVNDFHNTAQETPLMRAIESKNPCEEKKLTIIKALIDAGANGMLGGEENAFMLAKRQPYPIREKILELLDGRRD